MQQSWLQELQQRLLRHLQQRLLQHLPQRQQEHQQRHRQCLRLKAAVRLTRGHVVEVIPAAVIRADYLGRIMAGARWTQADHPRPKMTAGRVVAWMSHCWRMSQDGMHGSLGMQGGGGCNCMWIVYLRGLSHPCQTKLQAFSTFMSPKICCQWRYSRGCNVAMLPCI